MSIRIIGPASLQTARSVRRFEEACRKALARRERLRKQLERKARRGRVAVPALA